MEGRGEASHCCRARSRAVEEWDARDRERERGFDGYGKLSKKQAAAFTTWQVLLWLSGWTGLSIGALGVARQGTGDRDGGRPSQWRQLWWVPEWHAVHWNLGKAAGSPAAPAIAALYCIVCTRQLQSLFLSSCGPATFSPLARVRETIQFRPCPQVSVYCTCSHTTWYAHYGRYLEYIVTNVALAERAASVLGTCSQSPASQIPSPVCSLLSVFRCPCFAECLLFFFSLLPSLPSISLVAQTPHGSASKEAEESGAGRESRKSGRYGR